MKHTKILATIGPSSDNSETLLEMIKEGVNLFRMNFSHGDEEYHLNNLLRIKTINEMYQKNIGVLQDISGPKIRITKVNGKISLQKGQTIIFSKTETKEYCEKDSKNNVLLYLNNYEVLQYLKQGEFIFLADGQIKLEVTKITDEEVITIIKNDGVISSNKGVNFPNTKINIDVLTEKDKKDLEWGIMHEVDFVAISFVQSHKDVKYVKSLIKEYTEKHNKPTPMIISKIEKFDAVEDIENITKESDGIMIARGDLGIEIPFYKVPVVQKEIINICKDYCKPCIVATQVMLSMTENVTATRSEISDVANAVFDGADAVMLSEETAVGINPVKVIRTMAKIMKETEKSFKTSDYPMNYNIKSSSSIFFSKTVSQMSENLDTSGIITFTTSGKSSLYISKNLRNRNNIIFCIPHNNNVARKLSIVKSIYVPFIKEKDSESEREIIIKESFQELYEKELIDLNKKYILAYGNKFGKSGSLNSLKYVQEDELNFFVSKNPLK